jgi:hypothetical protein
MAKYRKGDLVEITEGVYAGITLHVQDYKDHSEVGNGQSTYTLGVLASPPMLVNMKESNLKRIRSAPKFHIGQRVMLRGSHQQLQGAFCIDAVTYNDGNTYDVSGGFYTFYREDGTELHRVPVAFTSVCEIDLREAKMGRLPQVFHDDDEDEE